MARSRREAYTTSDAGEAWGDGVDQWAAEERCSAHCQAPQRVLGRGRPRIIGIAVAAIGTRHGPDQLGPVPVWSEIPAPYPLDDSVELPERAATLPLPCV